MSTISNLFQGLIIGAILGSIAMAFMVGVKLGYDHFEAFRAIIDTVGNAMLHNPFA